MTELVVLYEFCVGDDDSGWMTNNNEHWFHKDLIEERNRKSRKLKIFIFFFIIIFLYKKQFKKLRNSIVYHVYVCL